MATMREIAVQYLGRASLAKDVDTQQAVLRDAANTFMGLAFDPKHAPISLQLTSLGREFASAAYREHAVTVDDFTDLLRETDQAYNEAGDDPMDLIARRREIHDERTPIQKGHVSIAPESFNRDATLGRSANIKFNPTPDEVANNVQQIQTVAFWQGFKKEAQAMTVDVNLVSVKDDFVPVPSDNNNPAFAVRAFAEVGYGSDGNITKVRFDIGLGKRLTIVGNYVEVNVGCHFPGLAGNGQPNPTSIIRAGASIGPFAAPTSAPLVYTVYMLSFDNEAVDQLGPGQGTNFMPIPVKSALLLPLQTNLALGGTALITFYDYGKQPIYQTFYVQAANNTMLPVPITGDAAWVRVDNTSATSARFRLPFQLAM